MGADVAQSMGGVAQGTPGGSLRIYARSMRRHSWSPLSASAQFRTC